jgi:hypothetical protein
MAFEMPTGLLTYSVDGTAVTKHVQRFSFRGMDLSGDYVGYQSQATTSTGTALTDEMTIHVGQSGRNVTMTTQGSISGACTWTGTVTPAGQLASVQGSYACGDGRTGTFFMYDADVTDAGFTARFTGNRITSAVSGMMAGARTGGFVRGDGWRTDMWWVPTESGWGINLIEQGDILFATIFTYDAQGRAKWYSASSLAFTGRGPAVDSTGVYSGSVEESTGPYFGTSFNPASVTRRTVGSMSFDVYGNRTGLVDLSIGSATLARKVVDRYTFRTIDPSGTYAGNVQALLNSRNVPTGPTTFNIVANGGSVTITTQAAGGTCTYIATNAAVMQYGQQMLPAGSFSCSNGTSGQFFWPDMAVTYAGFTAHYNIDGYVVGNIGAVRTGPFASL